MYNEVVNGGHMEELTFIKHTHTHLHKYRCLNISKIIIINKIITYTSSNSEIHSLGDKNIFLICPKYFASLKVDLNICEIWSTDK